MSKAEIAKKIILEKLQSFVHQIQTDGQPFEFKREDGGTLSFEVSEIQDCLSQMEHELSVIKREPYDYLQWDIPVPLSDAVNGQDFFGRYFNVRKLDLIEAMINRCFGDNVCEGSFKPTMTPSDNHVPGAVYIYERAIDQIVNGNLDQPAQITDDKDAERESSVTSRREQEISLFPDTKNSGVKEKGNEEIEKGLPTTEKKKKTTKKKVTSKPSDKELLQPNALLPNEKPDVTLKQLIDAEAGLTMVTACWYFLKQERGDNFTEDEQSELNQSEKILSKQLPYLCQIKEMLIVLEAYVAILNQLKRENDLQHTKLEQTIRPILTNLDMLIGFLNGIEALENHLLENTLLSITQRFNLLNEAIVTAEAELQLMGHKSADLIKNLPSQQTKCQEFEELSVLIQELKAGQYSLYAIVVSSLVVSIVEGVLLAATPYLAISLGIALIGCFISEVIRQNKNVAEEEMDARKPAQNALVTFSDYLNTDFKSSVRPSVDKTYSSFQFFKQEIVNNGNAFIPEVDTFLELK